jgi:sugar/nucleoside kinase (ribokinase family)
MTGEPAARNLLLVAVGGFGWEEVVEGNTVTRSLGGALLHFASAASVSGAPPALVSRCTTREATHLLPRLRSGGMDTAGVEVVQGELTRFRMRYDENEDLVLDDFVLTPAQFGNTVYQPAERLFRILSTSKARPWTHVCPDVPDVFLDLCVVAGELAAPSSAQIHQSMLDMDLEKVRRSLTHVQMAFMTERELCNLFDTGDLEIGVATAQNQREPTYIATSRDRVTIIHQGDVIRFPTPLIRAVDPTGAGDSLAGGLLGALVTGAELDRAVRQGVLCALACVTDFGPRALMRLGSPTSRMETDC